MVVKAIDQLIQQKLTPALRPEGFVRRGRIFRCDLGRDGKVFVHLHPFALPHQPDISMFVDVNVQPRVWAAWEEGRGVGGDDGKTGMLSRRVVPSEGAAGPAGTWAFEIDDEDACQQLIQALLDQTRTYKSLLAPGRLLDAFLDHSVPSPGEFTPGWAIAVGLLLSEAGPSDALEQILKQIALSDPNEGVVGEFIRRNAARSVGGNH